jgi:amidohydrolase
MRPAAIGVLSLLLCPLALGGAAVRAASPVQLPGLADQELDSLVALYKRVHAAPELSHHEQKTSALLATELRSAGFEVTEHVGKYSTPDLTGYGVVAVMKNGAGPMVLVRADMDALPVEEQTGLEYASHVRARDDSGTEVPVMHACGHDIHVATLIGTARVLSRLKSAWHGTLLLIGQPAEERIDGARAMLADGLYARFGRPDFALALHDAADLEVGTVGYVAGYMLASSTSVDVTIRGVGGHGAYPQATKDPIVMAAEYILALQTIISRETSPFDPGVVTVGSIQGGTKHNVIPDEVHLQLTVRAYKEEVRQHILDSLGRIARGIAEAGGVPADRAPIVKVSDSEVTGSTYNDPVLTGRVAAAIKRVLGAGQVLQLEPEMASEDFGLFGLKDHEIPTVMFRVGAIDAERMARAKATGVPLPSLHSSLFWPVPGPTIRTGVIAMSAAVLDLLSHPAAAPRPTPGPVLR